MNYKDGKMILIIKEMLYSSNKYEINGIDLEKAVFFVRKKRELFKIVAPGDFAIKYEGANVYLVLNSAILTDIISIQVCYESNTESRLYEPDSEPDINILVTNYNKLVQDFKNLWGYIQKQTFVSDTLNMSLVFPALGEGETWIYKDGEMRAVLLYDAIEELRKSVEQVRQEIKTELENKINEFNTQINTLITGFRTEIRNIIDTGKSDINSIISTFNTDWAALVAQSKKEINDLTASNKTTITELTNTSKNEITTHTTNQKNTITTLINNSKTEINTLVQNEKTNITNLSIAEKTDITDLAEEKKDEITELAAQIVGFDPADYFLKGNTQYNNAKEMEDAILQNAGGIKEMIQLWIGNKPIADGEYIDTTLTGILAGVDKGILRIVFNKSEQGNYDILVPVPTLGQGFNTIFPIFQEYKYALLFTISRNNNDLKIAETIYTVPPAGVQIKNVYLIK